MSDIGERIAAWQAAGLIDGATADRLRAAEAIPAAAAVPPPEPGAAGQPIEAAGPSVAAAWFGPGVTIPEVFGYLGAGFLLAAWSAFVARLAGDGRENVIGAGSIAAAVVLVALGMWLATGDARRSRAAGVASLAAIAFATGGVFAFFATGDVDGVVAADPGHGRGHGAGRRLARGPSRAADPVRPPERPHVVRRARCWPGSSCSSGPIDSRSRNPALSSQPPDPIRGSWRSRRRSGGSSRRL